MAIRFLIGGWVAKIPAIHLMSFNSEMKIGVLFPGPLSINICLTSLFFRLSSDEFPDILRSALAKPSGFLVISAAPASARYSLFLLIENLKKIDKRYIASETKRITSVMMKPPLPSFFLEFLLLPPCNMPRITD